VFNNAKASPEAILEPHIRATMKRMAAVAGPALVVQDTVFFSYGEHRKTKGLGPIGSSNGEGGQGLIMHNALAFTTSGVPLGVLSERIWAREPVPEEGYQEKIERLQCTPVEEKESSKWLLGLRETLARTAPGVQVVTVADRESDFFEFLAEATAVEAAFVIRARTDRVLVAEDSQGSASIEQALLDAEVLGTVAVEIPGNARRQGRTAEVEVRTVAVTVKAPARRGKAKASGMDEPVRVTVIGATERTPAPGQTALGWVLLTNLPVGGLRSAAEKVHWYAKRWGIETWHKVLESGCKVEDCLLESAERLGRYLTLFSIIAVRLMYVGYLARVQPQAPATEVFSPEEIEALHIRLTQRLPPAEPPTLREVVRMIGRVGGHLGRKGDGEPGMTVLWRGWMRLHEDVLVVRACKEALGQGGGG
ncbi:MAG: IS4 family transposase, partial [Acidobacteriota bacterium]